MLLKHLSLYNVSKVDSPKRLFYYFFYYYFLPIKNEKGLKKSLLKLAYSESQKWHKQMIKEVCNLGIHINTIYKEKMRG